MFKDLGKALLKLIGLEYSNKSTISIQNPTAYAPYPVPAPPQTQNWQTKPDVMYTNGLMSANSDKGAGNTKVKEPANPGNMQKKVEEGQAPKEVDR